MFFVHIFFFCGNVSRLDHVDQVNFAYLNSELSRKKKREAEGDAREIKFSQMGWVLCSTNWFWRRDSHLWDEVWRLRACRANMWWSVVVFESDVMDMLMSVKDLPNTCQGLNHRFFTWLQHLLFNQAHGVLLLFPLGRCVVLALEDRKLQAAVFTKAPWSIQEAVKSTRAWEFGCLALLPQNCSYLAFLSIQISMDFSVAGKRWYSQVAYNHRIGSIWNRFTRSLQGFVQPTTIFLNQRKPWQSGNVRHVILKISVKTSEMCSLEVPCVLKCSEDGTVSQSCGTSSLSALDLLSSTLPDPESSRHHY